MWSRTVTDQAEYDTPGGQPEFWAALSGQLCLTDECAGQLSPRGARSACLTRAREVVKVSHVADIAGSARRRNVDPVPLVPEVERSAFAGYRFSPEVIGVVLRW